MTRSLVVLGSVNADLFIDVPRLPQLGETLRGHGTLLQPGGKGANQAAAAARLGCPVHLVGQVGEDPFAPDLRRALESAGVGCTLLASVPGPSGQAFILLQDGGENAIVLLGGANAAWNHPPEGFDPLMSGAGALLLQCEVPEAVNLAAARHARSQGLPVVLDAGGTDRRPGEALLQAVNVLSPNETELAALTGLPTDTREDVIRAAQTLRTCGVEQVLVKLGARGCLLVRPDGSLLEQAAFPVDVVDTTGAGDCFTAAYVVGMLEGLPEADRLRFASAAAALCVTSRGALPSMPDRAAVASFLRQQSE